MFKVKIDVPGWDSYTGLLGMVPFENGISTRPVTDHEATKLGALLRVVRIDSDEQIGASTIMAGSRHISAEVAPSIIATKEEEKPVKELKYSKDRLDEIASEGGIKAIREIAKEFDVKGVEISKMIEEIMQVQLGTKEDE
jgi:hypothetical protein